ncbi:MAG: sugar ABC transporter permease [Clostridia bacterium]|nr:sugar ABC transporter permease [Clostridia bacterium]
MKSGYAAKRRTANIVIYVILSVMVLIWVFPIVWLVMQSFNTLDRVSTNLFPEGFTLKHYQTLFTDPNVPYGRWMLNTFLVALFSCIISTLFVLMVSYALSRLRFKSRKKLLNMGLILGMFPGFMSMAATYSIMEIFHLDGQLIALVIVYSSGAGLGYQVAKGFFDTIPRALDEAARIDGATSNRIFWVIILPLSKPIIVYTALTTFLGPWADYIFVSYFMKDNDQNFTIALGLYQLLDNEHISTYFTTFCAGAVLIAIPITILFIFMQRYYVSGVTGGAVKG